jgi:hypothetical protein
VARRLRWWLLAVDVARLEHAGGDAAVRALLFRRTIGASSSASVQGRMTNRQQGAGAAGEARWRQGAWPEEEAAREVRWSGERCQLGSKTAIETVGKSGDVDSRGWGLFK